MRTPLGLAANLTWNADQSFAKQFWTTWSSAAVLVQGTDLVSLSAQTDRIPLVRFEMRLSDMATILIVVLVLMLLGTFPTWNHSRQWGYGPSGGLGLIVVVLIVLMLSGRL